MRRACRRESFSLSFLSLFICFSRLSLSLSLQLTLVLDDLVVGHVAVEAPVASIVVVVVVPVAVLAPSVVVTGLLLATAARGNQLGRDGRELDSIRVLLGESHVARAWYQAPLW